MEFNEDSQSPFSTNVQQQQQQRRCNLPRDDVIPRLQSPVHRQQRVALRSAVDAADAILTPPPRQTVMMSDTEPEDSEGDEKAATRDCTRVGRCGGGNERCNHVDVDDDGFVPVRPTSSTALESGGGGEVSTATASGRPNPFTSGFADDDTEGLSHPLESPIMAAAAAASLQGTSFGNTTTTPTQRREGAETNSTHLSIAGDVVAQGQPEQQQCGNPQHHHNNTSSSMAYYSSASSSYHHGPKPSLPPPTPCIGRQHRFSTGDSAVAAASPSSATTFGTSASNNNNNNGVGGSGITRTGQPLLATPKQHVSSENWGTVTRFGFPMSEYEHIAEAERHSRRLADDAAALCDKMWASALRGVPLLANATDETSAPLRNLVRKYGIPPHLRGIMWLTLSGVALTMEENEQFCHTLLDTYGSYFDAATSDAIEKDLDRTFPDHPYFAHDDIGQTKLRRVLHALCWRNPVLGYCQSFNFLAGTILLVMEDEEATFWFMCFLLETVLPNDCYDRSLTGIKVDQEVVLELVDDLFPRLAAHFVAVRFDVRALVPAWVLSIFVNTFPMETAVRIWDVLITRSGGDGSLSAGSGGKGANHVSQRVSGRSALPISVLLAFLKWHQDALLALDDAGEMMQYLTHAASTCFDKERLVHMALAVQLSPLQLHQLRRQKRIQLRRQEADRRRDRPAAMTRRNSDSGAVAIAAVNSSATDAAVVGNGTSSALVAPPDSEPPLSPFTGSDTDAYRRIGAMATDWAAEAPRHAEEDLLLARQDMDSLVEMRELTPSALVESE